MSNQTDEQKMEQLAKILTDFAENNNIPPYLRWGLQVLFVAGSDSTERSNVVAGLMSVGERAFDKAIEKIKASGDAEGGEKLINDKAQMLKMAMAIDLAGAMASLLKGKLGEAGKDVIVAVASEPSKPEAVFPYKGKDNPFAGRN